MLKFPASQLSVCLSKTRAWMAKGYCCVRGIQKAPNLFSLPPPTYQSRLGALNNTNLRLYSHERNCQARRKKTLQNCTNCVFCAFLYDSSKIKRGQIMCCCCFFFVFVVIVAAATTALKILCTKLSLVCLSVCLSVSP